MIYYGCGLRRSEGVALDISDIHLRKSLVHVRRSKTGKARYVPLSAAGVSRLADLAICGQRLLWSPTLRSGPIPGGRRQTPLFSSIIRRLKRNFPPLRNASQLRQSRIRVWLEEYDLREVQYRAGHRYISSTERYGMPGLKDLKQELDKYHPLG